MMAETARPTWRRRILWASAILVVALPLWCVLAFYVYMWPGGVHPTYNAVDHDLLLTHYAKGAKPVIEVAERERRESGDYPVSMTNTGGWEYTRTQDGYVLDLRLGWDPDLQYVVEGTRSRWVFVPGDGTGEKTIALSP